MTAHAYRLWIDDERPMPLGYNKNARTSEEALAILREAIALAHPLELVSFDHDLGGDDTTRRILTWMIENDFWPDTIRIHTANPIGLDWLRGTAERYSPGRVQIVIAPVTGENR